VRPVNLSGPAISTPAGKIGLLIELGLGGIENNKLKQISSRYNLFISEIYDAGKALVGQAELF
jgi:hypothetical protein